ncbi:serine/arginine repetitive matrix protein 2 [Nocardioidaceae bacterium Broad-1]|nr:serine/arginine repetitive matrix protein 2 [Nocardioidaceae bacterium Broad-1]
MSAIRAGQDECGSAAPLSRFGAIGLLLLLRCGAWVVWGAVFVDPPPPRQSAADLAALAGANALQISEDACAAATTITERNGARLESCEVAGEDVTVTVRVEGPRWLGQPGDPAAKARAGPTGPD